MLDPHPTHRPASRRGIAMIMVMVAVTVVFIVGMSLVSSLPATARASSNMIDRDTSVFLAESGLTEGLYRLANPPAGQTIWSGVAGRTLPGVPGSYDVAIANISGDTYRITATGSMIGRSGQSLTHAIHMDVTVVVAGGGMSMQHAMVIGNSGFIPWSLDVEGDLHVNGNVFNLGNISGTLSASGNITNLGSTGGTDPGAEAVEMPTVELDDYETYTYNGSTYAAEVLTEAQANSLPPNYYPASPTNPLGVVVVEETLSLANDLHIHDGIFVVRGHLVVNNNDLEIDGPDNQMSLLVENNVYMNRNGSDVDVSTGTAYVGNRVISSWGARNSTFTAREGLIAVGGLPIFYPGNLDVSFQAVQDDGSSQVSYFGAAGGGGSGQQTVTVLDYLHAATAN